MKLRPTDNPVRPFERRYDWDVLILGLLVIIAAIGLALGWK